MVDGKLNGDILELTFSGRIESTNSAEADAAVQKLAAENPHESITIDANDLTYISSAGLRVLMRLQKGEKNKISVVNVSPEVYDIFDMTGFSQILDVKKALRFVSTEGLELIGRGGNGNVYRLDRDTMIKSFYNIKDVADIDRGREYARTAFILGIPTAISYETVKCEDGYGTLFELLHAKPLSDVIMEDEEHREEYIDKYLDMLIQLHTTETEPGSFPDMIEVLDSILEQYAKPLVTEAEYDLLQRFLNSIPRRNTIVHGDFHTHNIMVQDGELILIDMDDICVGHPVIELGGMLLSYYYLPKLGTPETKAAFQHLSDEVSYHVWDRTLRRYFNTNDEAKLAEYNKLLLPYMDFRKFTHGIVRPMDEKLKAFIMENTRRTTFPMLEQAMKNTDFLKEMPVL